MARTLRNIAGYVGFTCGLGALILTTAVEAAANDSPQAESRALGAQPVTTGDEAQLEPRPFEVELSSDSGEPFVAVQRPPDDGSASGDNCGACNPGYCSGQIGIKGDYVQECQDGGWISTAFPIFAPAFNTVRVRMNINRVGGDVYIMRNVPGDCQPDTTQVLVTMCCALEGLDPSVPQELHFPLTIGSSDEPTWVVFVGRTGLAGQDSEGVFNGATLSGTKVARDLDSGSAPGRAFFNLVGTGNPGDWSDLNNLGLGNCYCAELLNIFGAVPDTFDCATAPTGACCLDPAGETCEQRRGFECGIIGGTFLGDGTVCGEDACPVCGNGVDELGERCDGADPGYCFQGLCRDDCQCVCLPPFPNDPENDCCLNALLIDVGDTAFDTASASTDGLPNPPDACGDLGSSDTRHDVWYEFTAECNGNLIVSTCESEGACAGGAGGSAQYDTSIVVYEGCEECPPSVDSLVGCNDDYSGQGACCGDARFHSVVQTDVQGGTCYKIRVGGSEPGNLGSGILHIELECVVPEESLIIKQGATPAPVNPHSNGVIPMVLAGSDTLDVSTIDLDSLRLRRCDGVGGEMAPLAEHTKIKDLNHPAAPVACPGCSNNPNQSSDGVDDLSLKFRTDETLAMLDLGVGNGVVTVELIGTSAAGDFVARDCMVVVPPGVGQSTLTLGANVSDTFIGISPLDINVDSDGFTDFSRGYIAGTNVTLTAPATSEGRKFVRWSIDGVLQPVGRRTLQMTAGADTNLKAIYGHGARLNVDRLTSDEGLEE